MDGGRTVEASGLRPWRGRPPHRSTIDRDLLAAVVESSEDAIVTKTLDGTVTSWNEGAERIFGYTAQEMIGQPITRLFPPDRLQEEEVILGRIRHGERVEHFETRRMRKDGAAIDLSVTISPLRDDRGRLVGASKVARDITERKEAERERALLASIVGTSTDAILAKTLDGIVTSWNPGAEALLGHTAQEMVGRSFLAIVPAPRLEEELRAVEAVRRGETVKQETQYLRRDGSLLDVLATDAPLLRRDGTVFGCAKVAHDITERKRHEVREREQAQAQIQALHELEAFRTRFINSAAHELANPLTPMAIQLRLLRRRATDPQLARSAGILERNFRRLERGIRDLLDAARIEGNRLTIVRRRVRLRALLDEAAESFGPPAQAVGLTLRVGEVSDLALEVDGERLMQVLYNLLSNAVKFTPLGGEVVLDATTRAGKVCICVRDTGLGMEPGQLERLFRPYHQVHDPKLSPGVGMGLGLYISRALVEAHGGRIWAESGGLGKGTKFCVELPLEMPVPHAAPDVPRPGARPAGPSGPPGQT
ncbi:MAG: PAS domain S-box protein [Thermoplasmatota archaeon]